MSTPVLNQRKKSLRSASIPRQSSSVTSSKSSQRVPKTATTVVNSGTPVGSSNSKRKANSPPAPEHPQPAKKMPNPDAITADGMRSLFEEFTGKMQSQLTETITSTVQKEVNMLGDQLKADFRTQLDDINSKFDEYKRSFDGKLEAMQAMVDSCVSRTNFSEDDVQRLAKLCELKIRGIPYQVDENLHGLFAHIAQFVGSTCQPKIICLF